MLSVVTTIAIRATPDKVWNVLADFDRYREWSVFINEIIGTPTLGSPLRVVLSTEGKRDTLVRPRVSAADPGRRFAWTGHLLHPTLFAGTHEFLLDGDAHGQTRLTHAERFSGLLPTILRKPPKGAHGAFSRFNDALKARAPNGWGLKSGIRRV